MIYVEIKWEKSIARLMDHSVGVHMGLNSIHSKSGKSYLQKPIESEHVFSFSDHIYLRVIAVYILLCMNKKVYTFNFTRHARKWLATFGFLTYRI